MRVKVWIATTPEMHKKQLSDRHFKYQSQSKHRKVWSRLSKQITESINVLLSEKLDMFECASGFVYMRMSY